MGGRYHLVDDYFATKPANAAEREDLAKDFTTAPACLIAFIRRALPASFSRKTFASVTNDPTEGVRLRADTLLCTSMFSAHVSRPKANFLKTMQVTLAPDRNWWAEVKPGDDIFCWILPAWRLADLIERVRQGQQCNQPEFGIRFQGRVTDGPHRNRVKTQDRGMQTTSWTLQAVQFKELASSVFYDPHLAEFHRTMASWLAKLDKAIQDLLYNPTDDPGATATISVNRAIPFFLDVLVGSGIPLRYANPGNEPELRIASGSASGLEPDSAGEAPFAYVVPESVGSLLGKRSRSKKGGVLAYADLLELMMGVQRYSSRPEGLRAFLPDGTDRPENVGRQHKYTGQPLLGHFVPQIPDFSNKTVWAIMSQFLNPTINEMYTAMRANADGVVVPMMVVRQLPFSSDAMLQRLEARKENGPPSPLTQKLRLTPFSELPRWVVHPSLVTADSFGPSDALRFNFFHVYGQAAMAQRNNALTFQLIRNPPIRDDLDIQRSGLQPYMTTVACSLEDTVEGPRAWMEVSADILSGGQLLHTGQLSLLGLWAPIAEGDNIEYEGAVYHIEQLTHTFTQDANGGDRSFRTFLDLSHGQDAEQGDSEAGPTYLPRQRAGETPDAISVEDLYDSPDNGRFRIDADAGRLASLAKDVA